MSFNDPGRLRSAILSLKRRSFKHAKTLARHDAALVSQADAIEALTERVKELERWS
jgi:hypothetical protein